GRSHAGPSGAPCATAPNSSTAGWSCVTVKRRAACRVASCVARIETVIETRARTMFEKIWSRHVVAEGPGGHVLLYVDRHLLHEGSTSAFTRLAASGRRVRRPDLTFATADHYVLTSPGAAAIDAEIRTMVESLGQHTRAQGIVYFGVGDARRGIVHILGAADGLQHGDRGRRARRQGGAG